MSENDISLHYGQRLTRNLWLGVCVSPAFHNAFAIDVAGGAGGARTPQFHLRPGASASAASTS